MAWTEVAYVHFVSACLVEPFIELENTSSGEAECFAEACCMWWKMGSHESGFENNLVLDFQIALFQFQYEI